MDLCNTGRGGTDETVFTSPERLDEMGEVIFSAFAHPDELARMGHAQQVDEVARQMTGINMQHPFFEGNGRTTRAYIEQVADRAGIRIDWASFAGRHNEVMAAAAHLDQEPLRQALNTAITPAPPATVRKERVAGAVEPSVDEHRDATARLTRTHPDSILGRSTGQEGAGENPQTERGQAAGPAVERGREP